MPPPTLMRHGEEATSGVSSKMVGRRPVEAEDLQNGGLMSFIKASMWVTCHLACRHRATLKTERVWAARTAST